MIVTRRLEVQTKGEGDIVDLTSKIEEILQETRTTEGAAIVFAQSSTSAITTMEYEEGLVRDFPMALERIAPRSANYQHERAWHDDNGHSHIRSSVVGTSLTIPIQQGRLTLATWQQVVLMEFDTRARARSLVLQIITG